MTGRRALVFALAVYFIVHTFVPFGTTLLYPLTLLATWVHEMGHGITALCLGGTFSSLDVFADGAGLAHTASSHPWQSGLVAAGGLLAPPILGAVLLSVSRGPKRARIVLAVMALAIVVSLAVWVRSMAGWIALPIDAGVLAYFALRAGPHVRMVFAQLIGVALAIDTWSRKDYLFTGTATIDGEKIPSDISNFATAFGGPYLVWGFVLFAVSCGLLALGLWMAWRKQIFGHPGLKSGAAKSR